MAKSFADYIFRWLGHTFLDKTSLSEVFPDMGHGAEPATTARPAPAGVETPDRVDDQFHHFMEDAPACDNCGSITVRNGTCYRCYNCGISLGCS
jgi:ribonucleoside-diphosphate reductase alpha chain